MAEASGLSGLRVAHVAGVFSSRAFEGGSEAVREHRLEVLDLEQDFSGKVDVRARVWGRKGAPFIVQVHVQPDPLGFGGRCTCSNYASCEHIAAALLLLAQRGARLQEEWAGRPLRLSDELAAWLDRMVATEESESDEYPETVRQRLIYVFSCRPIPGESARLLVQPTSVRLLKDGRFAEKSSAVDVYNVLYSGATPKYLRPVDRKILQQLANARFQQRYLVGYVLTGEDGAAVLDAAIATGRARWETEDGPVLSLGEERDADLVWSLGPDARQRLECRPAGEQATAVPLAPPWYIDSAAGIAGPLRTGLAPRLAEALLLVPGVPPEQAAPLREAITARLPGVSQIELPVTPEVTRVEASPRGRLRLMSARPHPEYGTRWSPSGVMPVARPSFLYEGTEVAAGGKPGSVRLVRDGSIVEVVRDLAGERRLLDFLRSGGFKTLRAISPYGLADDRAEDLTFAGDDAYGEWLSFMYEGVSFLREDGWQVDVHPDFPIDVLRADGDIDARLDETTGVDWLELGLGVLIDGERVDIMASLIDLIARQPLASEELETPPEEGMVSFLRLRDRRMVGIPSQRIWPMLKALRELYDAGMVDPKDARVRFTPLDATELARVEAATGAAVAWTGGERLRELGSRLREAGGMPEVEPPAWFTGELRHYQAEGVRWLQFLRGSGFGAVLADDMGLGKTVQALAHFAIEKEAGRLDRPALIVAPTSVVPNWRAEAARFAPELRVLVLHGPTRKARFDEIAGHDLVLSTYPLLHRDRQTLLAQSWHTVVLDEAQAIKNPAANSSKIVRELDAGHRLCLTGTPVENHLGELWSLFSFLSPGFLGDRDRFNRIWRRPIEKDLNDERRRLLAQRVRPFLLRRTKSAVAAELPPKTEIIEHVEMDAAQRDVYETIRLAMHERVRKALAEKGLARSHIIVLDALLKLRQACCDPRLLKLKSTKSMNASSAKLTRLMEMLPQLVEDGARVLLFSQFTSMLALIQQELAKAEIPYVFLTGDTTDRETPIRRFQAGEVPLFLISLKAGGVGLNLTAADTVIHYDPWWNPAVEDQATDRAHRIGQEKPVFVYRMVTTGSIEEKMEQLKLRKREIAAGIFDPDAGTALDLTEHDIEALFTPID